MIFFKREYCNKKMSSSTDQDFLYLAKVSRYLYGFVSTEYTNKSTVKDILGREYQPEDEELPNQVVKIPIMDGSIKDIKDKKIYFNILQKSSIARFYIDQETAEKDQDNFINHILDNYEYVSLSTFIFGLELKRNDVKEIYQNQIISSSVNIGEFFSNEL